MAPVLTPFIHVPQHVEQSQVVWATGCRTPRPDPVTSARYHAYRPAGPHSTRNIGWSPPLPGTHTPIPPRLAGDSPSVAGHRHGSSSPRHTAPLVRLVAHSRQALLPAQPVAIGGGMIPVTPIHRAFGVGTVPVIIGMIVHRVLFHELLVLLDRHLLGSDGEPAGDDPAVRNLVWRIAPARSAASPCGTRPAPRSRRTSAPGCSRTSGGRPGP